MIDDTAKQEFREIVWENYRMRGRHDLPWRLPGPAGSFNPYQIMVSELMLQQTQVARVIPKYEEFLRQFPTVESLAAAPRATVLRAWNGLGYNRRAKFLHQAAQHIVRDYEGRLPESVDELMALPGIGAGTAGAIMAYALNRPAIFVETNIRTTFIHHFFRDQTGISDEEIIKLLAETLDEKRPREWYWALTDYGFYLKQTIGNLSRRSQTYAKQSRFQGSRRQLRGQVIRLLAERPQTAKELRSLVADDRLVAVLRELTEENLIVKQNNRFRL